MMFSSIVRRGGFWTSGGERSVAVPLQSPRRGQRVRSSKPVKRFNSASNAHRPRHHVGLGPGVNPPTRVPWRAGQVRLVPWTLSS